ncbi:hypothetical protein Tco_1424806, partial [Tanacetum coccineum]
MQNSPVYKTYLAYATGAATPKKARKFKKLEGMLTLEIVFVAYGEFVSKVMSFKLWRSLLREKYWIIRKRCKTLLLVIQKSYLAYATGAATPKKARKFKKLVSPSKKRTLIIVEEENPEPSNKFKKAPETTEKSKGIDLLSEVALLEEAQVKKVLKRSQWETTINQAGGSGDGTGSKPGNPDEPKGDDKDFQDSDDDPQQANDERTDYENQEINDYEEESANEFVHTPEDYVPTDDETNDETKDVDREEYDRIDKELYGDVNVRLIDAEQDDEGEEDAYMTNDVHVHVEQTQEQTTG